MLVILNFLITEIVEEEGDTKDKTEEVKEENKADTDVKDAEVVETKPLDAEYGMCYDIRI